MSRDSDIIQRVIYHSDNFYHTKLINNYSFHSKNNSFIFSKYQTKLNLKSVFFQNPCRSIKMFYENKLIFHLQHLRTKSNIDTEIYLEKRQFNMLFF